ncbi:MAG: AAA family ATPase [Jaaginema sp. PMC 1079.18]|nr:AAA family ATPase [Jaaginema sp. PMC 1080.18]MEC4851947.1 AAA family ATPase [Jaaginema sp. PMC 1079.18]MEC4866459.1 AAA family ATPase [Jaaginema sp. PMC 1078.18]
MPKILCHFLIGIPASGKSTLACRLAHLTPETTIVSTDKIRGELFGNEIIQGEWPQVEALVIQRITAAIASHSPVIYDATNAQKEWRQEILKKLHFENVFWLAWWLKARVTISQQWNQQRSRQVPDEIITRMSVQLRDKPPRCDEGFIAIERIFPDISDLELQQKIEYYHQQLQKL